jgi:hypothetical protein
MISSCDQQLRRKEAFRPRPAERRAPPRVGASVLSLQNPFLEDLATLFDPFLKWLPLGTGGRGVAE